MERYYKSLKQKQNKIFVSNFASQTVFSRSKEKHNAQFSSKTYKNKNKPRYKAAKKST